MTYDTELDPNHDAVMEWFGGICPHCGREADTVHEIVPKSQMPRGWWVRSNRIPLCADFHFEIHNKIGTRKAAPVLYDLQRRTLVAMWTEAEVAEYYSEDNGKEENVTEQTKDE